MDYHQSVRSYVFEALDLKVIPPGSPSTVNIITDYRQYCIDHSIAVSLLADEFVARQEFGLVSGVSEYIESWNALGIPAPVGFVGKQGNTLVTYHHERFAELVGQEGLASHFGELHQWLGVQAERDFLFPCAVQLLAMGATRILITDTSGDAGVDLIGKFDVGPLSGTVVFVQAKTSNSVITREVVYAEYGKFRAGQNSEKGRDYASAIGASRTGAGLGPVFCIMANVEFKDNAKRAARELGVLLKSRRQISHDIAKVWSLQKIHNAKMGLGELRADLKRNVYHELGMLH